MMELLLTTNRVAVGDGGGHCAVDNLNVIEHLCGTHITCVVIYTAIVAVSAVPDLLFVGCWLLVVANCSFVVHLRKS